MTSYLDGSHNMRFSLDPDKWEPDLVKSSQADLVGYQEAEDPGPRAALRSHCTANDRGLYHPPGTGNPVSWKKDVFKPITGQRGVVEVHKRHPTAKFNPARDIVYVGLTHIESGYKILRINVHPIAGATQDEDTTEWDDELDAWKNQALANYSLDVMAFTAEQMSREYWNVISIGGDYNASMKNDDGWYYPGAMYPALFRPDPRADGLDHLQIAHGSDAKDGRRWTVRINSDHNLHLVRRTLVKVPDYPGVH